ncbi:MAG: hypothetical protein ACRENT_05955 [Thermodesulfobacteriota bacterium]
MNSIDMTATQMVWEPKLLKVTRIPSPGSDNEEPTTAYINARMVYGIHRTNASFSDCKDKPDINCTIIHYANTYLHVIETPEQIAAQRDALFGHSPLSIV